MPSSEMQPAPVMTHPSIDWEGGSNTASAFPDADWSNPEMKRRRSAPASQKASEGHMSTASDALLPEGSPQLSTEDFFEYQTAWGRSLPKVCLASDHNTLCRVAIAA